MAKEVNIIYFIQNKGTQEEKLKSNLSSGDAGSNK